MFQAGGLFEVSLRGLRPLQATPQTRLIPAPERRRAGAESFHPAILSGVPSDRASRRFMPNRRGLRRRILSRWLRKRLSGLRLERLGGFLHSP